MELQVGVKCILKNEDGRFLILKRNPDKYPGIKESWDLPGGRVQTGSNLEENLKREIKEETNLEVITIPKLLHAQDILRSDKHVVRLTYASECQGELKLDPTENIDSRWLFLEELNKIPDLDPYAREAYAKYASHFFPKLIRNNMPRLFKEKYGVETASKGIADSKLFKELLRKKLIEESTEVSVAHNEEDIKTELADVFEVIDALLTEYNFTKEQIAEIQKKKRDIKGGFNEKIYMEVPFNAE